MPTFDKYNLNLAGEFRVAAELLLRGIYASITFGNKKGADIYAIGKNRRSAVVEVKSSQTRSFVTSFYQKYSTQEKACPDFWVLYHVVPTPPGFCERFFVLTHLEMAEAQGACNSPGRELSYEQHVELAKRGVDNVKMAAIEQFEGQWSKIMAYCNGPG